MKKSSFPLVLLSLMVLLPAGFPAGATSSPSAGDYLIKLPKEETAKVPPYLLGHIRGIQELRTCWLALIDDSLGQTLSVLGIDSEILDANPEGKAYFLVRTGSPADETSLRGLGETRVLEGRTCLFWAGDLEAREILPASFAVKRLPLDRRLRIQVRTASPGPPLRVTRDRPRATKPETEDLIAGLVSQVSQANLGQSILNLQNFQTRYASTGACESAGTSLYEYFADRGLPVEYQSFTFSGNSYSSRNIVATLTGQSSPEEEVIVCAHYDSTSNKPATLAPGADDNASGTAAVMEIARILAGDSFDFTVKFICFSAEEWGLYGSEHYAAEAAAQGENIVGVINLDMISYAPSLPEDLDLYVNGSSQWLADRFSDAAAKYAPLSIRTILDPSADWSDHSPFWDHGFSALCGIEDSDNPYYHTTNDTYSTLNMSFTTSITRAALAAAADLAQPTYVVPTPGGLQARSQLSSSLFDSVKSVVLTWDAVTGPVSGYNVYRTTTPHGNYLKLNSDLLTNPEYDDEGLDPEVVHFYVVTAVDAQGRESNYSQEVSDDEND